MFKMVLYLFLRIEEFLFFIYIGFDYLGFLYVKVNGVIQKVWVCLFICLVVRVVYLEVIYDLLV